MSSPKEQPKLSLAAGAIALRGVQAFLSRGRAAADRRQAAPARKTKQRKPHAQAAISPKLMDNLKKNTHFNKCELESLFSMYRRLVLSAQSAAATSPMGEQPPKIEGIDRNTFRDVMHNTLELVTEEAVLERVWISWERGPAASEGALGFECWARGLSVMLRGTDKETTSHCFNVYDLNSDGYISRDEMFLLLKNSLLKQPGDEDPDEGVRDLVDLLLKKLDHDKDGKISLEDYRQAVNEEPLLLEAFGQCLPTRRQASAFLKNLNTKR